MVHPYYEISNKGLENNNIIEIHLCIKKNLQKLSNNDKQIQELLNKLKPYTSSDLQEKYNENKTSNENILLNFETQSNGFIDKKAKFEKFNEKYSEIAEIFYSHDITGLDENQLVNLTYLRNISLSSGYITQSNFQFSCINKENLIMGVEKAIKKLCKEMYENPDSIIDEILRSYDKNKIEISNNKYCSTIFVDTNEKLKDYIQAIEFYDNIIEIFLEICEDYNLEFGYKVVCTSLESISDIIIL